MMRGYKDPDHGRSCFEESTFPQIHLWDLRSGWRPRSTSSHILSPPWRARIEHLTANWSVHRRITPGRMVCKIWAAIRHRSTLASYSFHRLRVPGPRIGDEGPRGAWISRAMVPCVNSGLVVERQNKVLILAMQSTCANDVRIDAPAGWYVYRLIVVP